MWYMTFIIRYAYGLMRWSQDVTSLPRLRLWVSRHTMVDVCCLRWCSALSTTPESLLGGAWPGVTQLGLKWARLEGSRGGTAMPAHVFE